MTGLGLDEARVIAHHDRPKDATAQQVSRERRACRIYQGATEVHKWSLAKKFKYDWKVHSA
jgi:hypothetical protein